MLNLNPTVYRFFKDSFLHVNKRYIIYILDNICLNILMYGWIDILTNRIVEI